MQYAWSSNNVEHVQHIEHRPMSSTQAKGIRDAIAGLDLAIEALYPHTDFYRVSQKFFQRAIEGTIKLVRKKGSGSLE